MLLINSVAIIIMSSLFFKVQLKFTSNFLVFALITFLFKLIIIHVWYFRLFA